MKNKKGTTLIEVILYSAMFSIFIVAITIFSWDVTAGKMKNDSQAEVTDNAQIVLNQISAATRNARNIVTPTAGNSSTNLIVEMPDDSQNTFDLVDGRLRITNTRAARINLDVVLVIDVSGSMSGSPLTSEKSAANSFIDHLDSNMDQIGIVSFSSSATLRQQLTTDFSGAKSIVNGLTASGMTNYQDAINKTTTELTSVRHRPDASKVMIFMSDGVPNVCTPTGCNPTTAARAAADNAKANGIAIYTIGLVQSLSSSQLTAARTLLQYIASSQPGTNDHYFEAPSIDDLTDIYNQIAFLLTTSEAQNLTSSVVASQLNSISFVNTGASGTNGCIQINMLISRNNPSGWTEYDDDIQINSLITLKPN